MPSKRIKFIINPIAGFRRDKSDIIELIHRQCRTIDFDIVTTRQAGEGTRLAHEGAAQNCDIVVAVGGDGTVNEVASGIVHTNTALGIIPRGSGNGLARALGIPMQPGEAMEALLTSTERILDAGCAAERYFFAVTGVGFDAQVGQQFSTTRWRGPLPYFFIAAREFVSYHPEPVRIDFGQEPIELKPFLITIANTQQYGNGAIIAPQARPDDGILDLCMVESLSLWHAVQHIPKLFNGTIDRAPIIQYRKVRDIILEKPGTILFHVDGEPVTCQNRLKISILPRALKVAAPAAHRSTPRYAHAN
ncbi:MAG: diacylglycerol/lipid kinase family protein [bacterium]